MWKSLILISFLAIWGVACGDAARRAQSSETTTSAVDKGDGKHFGETITDGGAISYDALLMKMGDTDSLRVKVMGTAGDVCQAKGCWMDISGSEDKSPMRVRFKDYGFFMPKDITGRNVVVDGYAFRSVTSVEDLRHYAEDAGKSNEEIMKITEPKEEIKFMASGVLLLDK